MGVVYRAEDPALRRELAVKVMHPQLAAVPSARERFLREARAAATVQHPSIVPVYDVGEVDGLPYLVMPLLRGKTLADWSRGHGPRPPIRWLRLATAMADGLAAVHAAGLVHRDIKPSNVWLEAGERPGTFRRALLLDFGLARPAGGASELTDAGQVLGTLGYMAPEQVEGLPFDHRADLFSLGCVLYELATGTRPFVGATAFDVARRTVADHPPPPNVANPLVPVGLSEYILSLLAKRSDDRPATACMVRDTLRDIDVALRGRADSALSATSPGFKGLRATTRRSAGWTSILAVGFAASLLLAAVGWWAVWYLR
jgi:serine/threonine protein kinase